MKFSRKAPPRSDLILYESEFPFSNIKFVQPISLVFFKSSDLPPIFSIKLAEQTKLDLSVLILFKEFKSTSFESNCLE